MKRIKKSTGETVRVVNGKNDSDRKKNSEGSEQHPVSTLRNLPLFIRRSTFSAIPKKAFERDYWLDCT